MQEQPKRDDSVAKIIGQANTSESKIAQAGWADQEEAIGLALAKLKAEQGDTEVVCDDTRMLNIIRQKARTELPPSQFMKVRWIYIDEDGTEIPCWTEQPH